MLRLAQKAFYPGPIPFPLLHVDTGYKFKEMITFRDEYTRKLGVQLLVWRNEEAIAAGANPVALGTKRCCGLLKTTALLDGLRAHGFDAAFGGARRDEEKSRAKERIFSFRDSAGQWDPKNQRPELWNLYNARVNPGESIRVFPLSNWTELDVWHYIHLEQIPVVPLYFAQQRRMLVRGTASSRWSNPSCKAYPEKSSGCNAVCVLSAAAPAPEPFAPMPTPFPKSLPSWWPSALPSAPTGSSITTRTDRWS